MRHPSITKSREHAKLWGALASRANLGGSYRNHAFAKNLELNSRILATAVAE